MFLKLNIFNQIINLENFPIIIKNKKKYKE